MEIIQPGASTGRLDSPQPSYGPTQPFTKGLLNPVWNRITHSLDYTLLRIIEAPTSHDFPAGHFVCGGFFKALGEEGFRSGYSLMEWQYDQRRQAQIILPFLYLGPTSAARDVAFLKSHGITYLLGIRGSHPHHAYTVNADKAAAEAGITSENIVIENDQQLLKSFPEIIKRINDQMCCCPIHHHTNEGGVKAVPLKKALIFCETGNERSAAVVMAYLMAMVNYDAVSSYINVQGRRLCCSLSDSMKNDLDTFDTLLKAERDVFKHQGTTNGPITYSPRKRAFSNISEGNANIPDLDMLDEERFRERSAPVPFCESSYS
ncbi:hypothetical protein FQN52_003584 [Onygenales sp. PD_12]|nr:hypothetical protein FQN52_003584 [Onygenales sp. PD_12]